MKVATDLLLPAPFLLMTFSVTLDQFFCQGQQKHCEVPEKYYNLH